MKRKNIIHIFHAWMFLITFMSALGIKAFHDHDGSERVTFEGSASHNAELTAYCYTCEFVMHIADKVEPVEINPIVDDVPERVHLFSPQYVYRIVFSINTHSPPHLV